jgi:hypothetical protein
MSVQFFFSPQWQMCHDFKSFGKHIEIFMKKVQKIPVFAIDTDPNRPDQDTDPDPGK